MVKENIQFVKLKSSIEVRNILHVFNSVFEPSISERIDNFDKYTEKLQKNALIYSAKVDGADLGFLALYANDTNSLTAYITYLGVLPSAQNKKIGRSLLNFTFKLASDTGMSNVKLEVRKDNEKAIKLYKLNGFIVEGEASSESVYMIKNLEVVD